MKKEKVVEETKSNLIRGDNDLDDNRRVIGSHLSPEEGCTWELKQYISFPQSLL
jgi:hypothetical protein